MEGAERAHRLRVLEAVALRDLSNFVLGPTGQAELAERTMEERAAAELHSPLTGLAFSPWPELGVSADGLGWSRMPLCVGVDTRVVFSRFRAS